MPWPESDREPLDALIFACKNRPVRVLRIHVRTGVHEANADRFVFGDVCHLLSRASLVSGKQDSGCHIQASLGQATYTNISIDDQYLLLSRRRGVGNVAVNIVRSILVAVYHMSAFGSLIIERRSALGDESTADRTHCCRVCRLRQFGDDVSFQPLPAC